MSLQFYRGPAGSGKSWKLNHDLIEWSLAEPDKRFFLIVPDQFSMHTQMELAAASPRRGILNIEVLSFGRLAHRIFDEVGREPLVVLGDTGKSLVLRKVAAGIAAELPVIGAAMLQTGYIAEVKSTISEFMQYGITAADVAKMAEFADSRGALAAKLKDLQRLYAAFLAYIKDRFITTEETLDLLRRSLAKSELIRDSVVVFDGFTGFTPVQNRLIQEIMTLAERVIVSALRGATDEQDDEIKEQSLFYLTDKMVADLSRLAAEVGVTRLADVVMADGIPQRFRGGGAAGHELAHLEKHLFRYPLRPYGEAESIRISEVPSVAAEVRQAFVEIRRLTMEQGYRYQDIAIITGDMKSHAPYLEREAVKHGIPIYLDQTRGILLNPFTEFIRQALRVVIKNYSYETMFHFLRSGLCGFSDDEIDKLENYCVAGGIRTRSQWRAPFVRPLAAWREGEQAERLAALNHSREGVLAVLAPLERKAKSAGERVLTLYDFIVAARVQQKLAAFEERFAADGAAVKAKEYSQIYRLVMELLDQIYALLADEPLSLREFAEVLDAGLAEMRVGTIPQNIDRVVVGDIERTRLGKIRALFFIGLNDGNVPKSGGGGLISDFDREYLSASPWELAPTPRQRMFIQRLYLYINMTRPSEKLYLSYALVGSDGKSLRPSYLIETMRRLFPTTGHQAPEIAPRPPRFLSGDFDELYGMADSLDLFTEKLRGYARRQTVTDDDWAALCVLSRVYQRDGTYRALSERLIARAFSRYRHDPLLPSVADMLYGGMAAFSVSRLEQYAACAYAHFLQYGLTLREREEYGFEAVDLGNVFHGVLEDFGHRLDEARLGWHDFGDEEGARLLRLAIDDYVARHSAFVLYGNARNEHMIDRIGRIMLRTVRTLRSQLSCGDFRPERVEAAFTQTVDGALTLRGRIDRIDVCLADGAAYVKVLDYKSGQRRFELAGLYHGLQLQLCVYLDVALALMGQKYPDREIVPAAALYYHVADPLISSEMELCDEELEQKILTALRTTGIVNQDSEVVGHLDREFGQKSLVIPVEIKRNGEYSERSGVLDRDGFDLIRAYAGQKMRAMAAEIKDGHILLSPHKSGGEDACQYCRYQPVCGYDPRLPGCRPRYLPDFDRERVLELMRAAVKGNS